MRYSYEMWRERPSMVVRLDGEAVDGYVYPMLINNSIPGILKPKLVMDGKNGALVYDISRLVTLRQFVTRGVTWQIMERMYNHMEQTWQVMDEYLIPDRCCIWTADYMYVNPQTGMPGILCVPVHSYVSGPLVRERFIQGLEIATGIRHSPAQALPKSIPALEDSSEGAYGKVPEENGGISGTRQKNGRKRMRKDEKKKHDKAYVIPKNHTNNR